LVKRVLPLLVRFVSFVRVKHIFRVRVAFRRVLFSPPSFRLVLFKFRACPRLESHLLLRFVSSNASPMIYSWNPIPERLIGTKWGTVDVIKNCPKEIVLSTNIVNLSNCRLGMI